MSNRRYNILFLLIAFLAFATGVYLDKKAGRLQTEKLNPAKFEKVLHNKESLADAQLKNFSVRLTEHDYIENNGAFFFDSLDYDGFESQHIIYLIYELDSLRYWSSNEANFPRIYSDELEAKVNKIGSAWYEIRRAYSGNYKILALIKIKNEYPYENSYLQNSFLPEYSLPDNVNISLIPLSYGYDIKDINGEYVLSLINAKPELIKANDSFGVILLYILSFFFFLVFLSRFLLSARSSKLMIIVWSVLALARILSMIFHQPEIFYAHDFFSNNQSPFLFQSFGDFIFNLFMLVFIVLTATKRFSYNDIRGEKAGKKFDIVFALAANLLLLLYIAASVFVIDNFILNSGINLKIYDILSLDLYSVLSVFFIGSIFGIFLYLSFLLARAQKDFLSLKERIIYSTVAFVAVEALALLIFPGAIMAVGFAFLVILFFDFILQKNHCSKLYFYITVIAILALLATYIIVVDISKRQSAEVRKAAKELSEQRDAVAEVLLKDVYSQMQNDEMLLSYMHREVSLQTEHKIADYLRKAYFHGYWKQYSIDVYLCANDENMLNSRKIQVCYNDFADLINNYGKSVAEDIYFVAKPDGSIEYLIILNKGTVTLYIELNPKLVPETIGYPELLLDKNVTKTKTDFDYAKYKANGLLIKSGKYEYPKDGYKLFGSFGEDTTVCYGNYKHYVHFLQDGSGSYIVVSRPKITMFDVLITFAYIFVFYILLSAIFFLLLHLPSIGELSSLGFRTKLILSMLTILTLAFLSLGTVTVYYNMSKYKAKFEQEARSKLHSVATAMEFAMSENRISTDDIWSPYYQNMSSLEVKKQADIFGLDLNLYNKNGFLIATSRDRVFENELIGPYINHVAFDKLVLDKVQGYSHNEQIGKLKFASSYTVIETKKGNPVYLNVPFFANPQLVHEEVSDLIVTLINLYVLLFLLTTAVALFLSEQVITPLNVLQQKLKKFKVGEKYEKIDYKRKDEIGKLVEEYNKMVEKLDESIELLAKSERESAWRDMAKQIAHEIKNPLTPMKLSIQLLQRSWENKDENFDQRLREVTKTLIEQIETLKNIAEEFSTFAKMPQSNNEEIELAQKIENLVKLYDNLENVKVRAIIKKRPVYIWADNKHISRVFINLIKNAIQAIPDSVEGKVDIILEVIEDKALVKIKDNGTGIPEDIQSRLFTPSFTTKSSGMGLGLVMVKNIVTNAGGRIWFETELGKGTTFFIEFPLYKKSTSQ